ncbi:MULTISPECIES: CatB-related O-acetyltransferase [unclassified Pseudoalteromonas]|uniref:CatB-related O-acetyltransferase n=1 Tax=unclassified Pseudoalteromonas TaxID=194690 RepID=UPI0004BB3D66|nr:MULTISPECIES: CatB-related O-acetyltransferase [unclassified Pseudoalteromonas]
MIYVLKTIKRIVKNLLMNINGIDIDFRSDIKYSKFGKNDPSEKVYIRNSYASNAQLSLGCKLSDARIYGGVKLGRFVSIFGPGTVISQIKSEITIGAFSSIGQNVVIQDSSHRLDKISSYFMSRNIFNTGIDLDTQSSGSIVIEEDVWIGSNSVILPNLTLGRGCVVGAGAVVTKSIPRYAIAVGNPAKVIKYRFSEQHIDFLECLKWWDWDITKIKSNKDLFNGKVSDKLFLKVNEF